MKISQASLSFQKHKMINIIFLCTLVEHAVRLRIIFVFAVLIWD
jgi:hypothetical protein